MYSVISQLKHMLFTALSNQYFEMTWHEEDTNTDVYLDTKELKELIDFINNNL